MYVCLWSPAWSTGGGSSADGGGLGESGVDGSALALVDQAPRLRVGEEVIWADGRGLDAEALAGRLQSRLAASGVVARAGVAAVPIVAELAARWGTPPDRAEGSPSQGPAGGGDGASFLVKERTGWGWRRGGAVPVSSGSSEAVLVVERGGEGEWLSRLPIQALSPDPRLAALFEGVGLGTVGLLAALEREAVEVRLGADAVSLWRLARGDDRRRLFLPVPPERPHGSIDFVDYVLTDPARLVFTANALLGPLCDRLAGRGEHARTLRLALPLADGAEWERTIRPARPTASRDAWLRLIRGTLERLTVPDAVSGMRLEVVSTEPASVRQGDLFDRGFATASAVEAAVVRLADRQVVPLVPEKTSHPLIERRAEWSADLGPDQSRGRGRPIHGGSERSSEVGTGSAGLTTAGLVLQLLSEPRPILMETVARRDHEAPSRLRDRSGWQEVVMAAGPDRISGGRWEEEPYAREYFRCLTEQGVPLWVYRDGRDGGWYLHGWWD